MCLDFHLINLPLSVPIPIYLFSGKENIFFPQNCLRFPQLLIFPSDLLNYLLTDFSEMKQSERTYKENDEGSEC